MYHFREPTNEDLPFIVNSWLKSAREGPTLRGLSSSVYFKEHKKLILTLLNSEDTALVIAADDADPRHILGWAAGAPGVLHFVYVKHLLRRQGLARALTRVACSVACGAAGAAAASHWTPAAARYLADHPGSFEFNPYLAHKGV
jgi:hypothetical protein